MADLRSLSRKDVRQRPSVPVRPRSVIVATAGLLTPVPLDGLTLAPDPRGARADNASNAPASAK